MVAGSWMNNDGLYLQYGTQKAVPEVAGDYMSYGANRVVELYLDLTTLSTSSANILSNTTFFPGGNVFIEKVEMTVETAATGSTATLKVGLIQSDRSTVPSNYDHAFVNALAQTSLAAAGDLVVLSAGSTGAGGLIGSGPSSTTAPYYITAEAGTAVFTAGAVRIRIYYHGTGTITE